MTVATWDSLGKDDASGRRRRRRRGRTAHRVPRAGGGGAREVSRGRRPRPAAARSGPARPGRAARRPRLRRAARRKYGVKLGNDIVIDPANALPHGRRRDGPREPLRQPPDRAVARRGGNFRSIFPLARSVDEGGEAAGGSSPRRCSSRPRPEGWGETYLTNLDERGRRRIRGHAGPRLAGGRGRTGGRGEDRAAKAPPAWSSSATRASRPTARSRTGATRILFANAIHWLTGARSRSASRPKTLEQASLSLTRVAGPPDRLVLDRWGCRRLAILLGVWVWYRRRD